MKKLKYLISGILMLSLVVSGCSKKAEPEVVEEKKITVETMQSVLDDISVETTISGSFKASDEVDVVPKVMGKVTNVSVKEGQAVSKGQVLFTLDSQNAQSAVRNAKAAVENAQTAVETARISMERAEQQYNNAVLNYERSKQLYDAGAIPLTQLEQAELAASPLSLELAKTQYYQAQVAVDTAKGSLSDANIALGDFTVTAPISGTITAVNVNSGNVFGGGPAIKISNLANLTMKVDVSENLIKYFVVGETMDINVKSAGDTILSGKVKEILPPSQGSLTYPVEILVSNPPSEVKAGMFAEINITTESRNQVIAVPSEAVVVKEGNTIVYIIDKDKAKLVSVKTGLDNGKMVEITEGLNEGMEVVVKGQNFLEDGALVSVVKQEE